jgi:hypothetical protein
MTKPWLKRVATMFASGFKDFPAASFNREINILCLEHKNQDSLRRPDF